MVEQVMNSKQSSIKDLKKEDRPQERLEKLGPGPLTDRELLAMLSDLERSIMMFLQSRII